MKDFKAILDLWDNLRVLADDLSEKPSTVRKWRSRNSIPAHMWSDLIAVAQKRGFNVITSALLTDLAKKAATQPNP